MPAVVVTVLNRKGGVGKTTSAMMLACAGLGAGRLTLLLDADPIGSALRWDELAGSLPVTVLGCPTSAVGRQAREATAHYGLVVIDTASGVHPAHEPAVAASAVTVVPVAPSGHDVAELPATLDFIASVGGTAVVLITMADPRTVLYRELHEALDALEVPTLAAEIPARQQVRRLYGTRPRPPMWGYDDALAEILASLEGR